MNERYARVLGLDGYQSSTKYVCFLPFRGEFGWYLMTFVKRVHGYNHHKKIVCLKPGHEALFPTAEDFYYDWQDVSDHLKAGVYPNEDEEELKKKIIERFQTEDITFLSSSEASWEEKSSLAHHVFIPQPKINYGFKVDVVITPRNRQMDPLRNWTQDNWQYVVTKLVKHGYQVGVCGTKETSFHVEKAAYYSYDYLDVEADLNLMLAAKLVVSQESGLAYLSYLCQRPMIIIDHYHRDFGADLHRNPEVYFKNIPEVWKDADLLVREILAYLKETK